MALRKIPLAARQLVRRTTRASISQHKGCKKMPSDSRKLPRRTGSQLPEGNEFRDTTTSTYRKFTTTDCQLDGPNQHGNRLCQVSKDLLLELPSPIAGGICQNSTNSIDNPSIHPVLSPPYQMMFTKSRFVVEIGTSTLANVTSIGSGSSVGRAMD